MFGPIAFGVRFNGVLPPSVRSVLSGGLVAKVIVERTDVRKSVEDLNLFQPFLTALSFQLCLAQGTLHLPSHCAASLTAVLVREHIGLALLLVLVGDLDARGLTLDVGWFDGGACYGAGRDQYQHRYSKCPAHRQLWRRAVPSGTVACGTRGAAVVSYGWAIWRQLAVAVACAAAGACGRIAGLGAGRVCTGSRSTVHCTYNVGTDWHGQRGHFWAFFGHKKALARNSEAFQVYMYSCTLLQYCSIRPIPYVSASTAAAAAAAAAATAAEMRQVAPTAPPVTLVTLSSSSEGDKLLRQRTRAWAPPRLTRMLPPWLTGMLPPRLTGMLPLLPLPPIWQRHIIVLSHLLL
jgi:hypothetical protein